MTPSKIIFVIGIALLSVACTDTTSADCSLKYNHDLLIGTILPAVTEKYGSKVNVFKEVYNLQDPVLRESGRNVEIIFDQDKPGNNAMDTPFFVVVVDRCSRKVRSLFETDAWLNSPEDSK